MARTHSEEGMIPVEGGRVWYRAAGEGPGLPLLVLHGGPGYPHDYLTSLEALAEDRTVVFYDQLGCGRSDRPSNPDLWQVERFVRELAQIRAALDLDRIHLFGHSWGTMLAVDYMLTRPAGVASLVLASPALSIRNWTSDAEALKSQLPAETRATIDRCESTGQTNIPEYHEAIMAFYQRHVCRMSPWPRALELAMEGMGAGVYETMWGPSEICPTGILKDYDRTGRLAEIDTPALLTCGRFDESTPESTASYGDLIAGARVAVFEHSAHMAHLEEPELYCRVVSEFLLEHDPVA